MLTWQTERLRELATVQTSGHVVRVRPELVVEIAYDGLQSSTRYPGGCHAPVRPGPALPGGQAGRRKRTRSTRSSPAHVTPAPAPGCHVRRRGRAEGPVQAAQLRVSAVPVCARTCSGVR